jgi:hypothetical protein
MFIEILKHIPLWVYGVFIVLLAFGLSQARDRSASLSRITALPVVMVGLSLGGVLSAFGHEPLALLAWAAGLAASVVALHGRIDTSTVRYTAPQRLFQLPGSVWPLVLMMGIFMLKFGAGMSLALHPELKHSLPFAAVASAAYGIFSGVFLGRAIALWMVARRAHALPLAA